MNTSELAIAGYNLSLHRITLVEQVTHDGGTETYWFVVRGLDNEMQKVCVSYGSKQENGALSAASKEEAEQFIHGIRRAITDRIDEMHVA